MLGEHPSSLTELHAQKHQVNSQNKIHHLTSHACFIFGLAKTKPSKFEGRPFVFLSSFFFSFLLMDEIKIIHLNVMLANLESADASSDFSLFEALRETIYSEVATLISQNESRPHFLIELFHELQLLNTDYLRQRALYSLQVGRIDC